MITSVAVQAYLTRIGNLLMGQGFKGIFRDPSVSEASLKNMRVVYDAEEAMTEEWLSDELASTKMPRKGTTTKADVRSAPFMALFWKRSPLEPIVRQRYRVMDTPGESAGGGLYGKSTVSASFTIACVFVSNKAEAVEDLEEAFAAVFQNTYNMPLTTPKKDAHGNVTQVSSLQYIYNSEDVKDKIINFTYIQNMGESDLVTFKEGNLFAYSWSAKIFMNYVSEFAWSRVFPVEKVVVDLYNPKGIPLGSLDAAGTVRTHAYTADNGEVVPEVPDEPLIAFTRAEPRDYVPFAIVAPYSGTPGKITPEAKALIEGAVTGIGGEISLRGTDYMVIANMPLSANPPPEDVSSGSGSGHGVGEPDREAYMMSTHVALSEAIAAATEEEYVITPMPVEG